MQLRVQTIMNKLQYNIIHNYTNCFLDSIIIFDRHPPPLPSTAIILLLYIKRLRFFFFYFSPTLLSTWHLWITDVACAPLAVQKYENRNNHNNNIRRENGRKIYICYFDNATFSGDWLSIIILYYRRDDPCVRTRWFLYFPTACAL